MQYLDAGRAAGAKHIVVDPRRTATANGAHLHLQPLPGTDLALANGMLHIAIREGFVDEAYIEFNLLQDSDETIALLDRHRNRPVVVEYLEDGQLVTTSGVVVAVRADTALLLAGRRLIPIGLGGVVRVQSP